MSSPERIPNPKFSPTDEGILVGPDAGFREIPWPKSQTDPLRKAAIGGNLSQFIEKRSKEKDTKRSRRKHHDLRASCPCFPASGELFQRLDELRDGLGVFLREAGEGLLVRRLLGVIALGQHFSDLVSGHAGSLQSGADFALPFRAMAGGAFCFKGGGAISGECRHIDR